MASREQYKRKLLVEIRRLKADMKLVAQEDISPQRGVRLAEIETRIKGLILRLEAMENE